MTLPYAAWPTALDCHVWEASIRVPDDAMRLSDVVAGIAQGARVDLPFTFNPVIHNSDRSDNKHICQITISTLEVMLATWRFPELLKGLSALSPLPHGLVCPNIKHLVDSPLRLAPVVGHDLRNTFWGDVHSVVSRLKTVGSSPSSQELPHPIGPWECLTRLTSDMDMIDPSTGDELFAELSKVLPRPVIVDQGSFTRFLRGLSHAHDPDIGMAWLLLATGDAAGWQKSSGMNKFDPPVQAMIDRVVLQQQLAATPMKSARTLKM